MDPEFAALRSAIFTTTGELERFRQILVNCVIDTDIFDKEMCARRQDRWTKAFASPVLTEADVHRRATVVMQYVIQTSDIAHTMQHWHVYQKWNQRLFDEMYSAFRSGRSDTDPSVDWYSGELWFFDNQVIPLACKLQECGVFGSAGDEYLTYATANRSEWVHKGESTVPRFLSEFDQNGNHTTTEYAMI